MFYATARLLNIFMHCRMLSPRACCVQGGSSIDLKIEKEI